MLKVLFGTWFEILIGDDGKGIATFDDIVVD